VRLYYFWLDNPELAVARVALRVQRGGHHVPESDVRQRYARSSRNFFTLYRPLADLWHVYDNSTPGATRLIGRAEPGEDERILDRAKWDAFQETSK
jgi:predicted ABC-type ATPase